MVVAATIDFQKYRGNQAAPTGYLPPKTSLLFAARVYGGVPAQAKCNKWMMAASSVHESRSLTTRHRFLLGRRYNDHRDGHLILQPFL